MAFWIELGGKDDQGKADYFFRQILNLRGAFEHSTDTDEISRLTQQIQHYISQAFGLAPDDAEMRSKLLDIIGDVESITGRAGRSDRRRLAPLAPILIVLAITAIPFTIFMLRQVLAGRPENIDASRPEERPRMFVASLVLMAVLAAVSLRTPSLAFLARGVLTVAGIFLIAGLRWVKLSIYVAIACMAAVSMFPTSRPVAITLAALVPLLAWPRMTMKRHTLTEIALGAALGVGAGGVLLV